MEFKPELVDRATPPPQQNQRSGDDVDPETNFRHDPNAESFDDVASTSTEESSNSKRFEKTNRRIILQRFTVYNSSTTMYIVGSNAKESLFRIIEINSDKSSTLSIIEDKNFFYTRKDVVELMKGLNDSIDGGIHKIAHAYGLLGFIKFTNDYYLSIITKCSQVAVLGGHFIYHVDETKLIPLKIDYQRPSKYSDEEKLLSIFKYLDLGKTFYFSYTYDITNTLQDNLMRLRRNEKFGKESTSSESHFELNNRFVWNGLLLQPANDTGITTYDWFQPIIHGFIDQASISIYGRKLFITIIARRSHHFAGARFLKRGVNHNGDVANEVETEQIVNDMITSSFHDPKFGLYANPKITSYVQHRGSIPLYWTQDLNRLPKPPIEINLSDPFYQSSALHLNDLIERYGNPIIILNLIKTKEKHPRELKLSRQFVNCVTYLNQFLPNGQKLQYYSFDMSKHSKKNADVIGPLQSLANTSIKKTGFFHNGKTLQETKKQHGVIRTNCIDCLDRTNAAQFIICKEALAQQLKSLGFLTSSASLDYDSDLINILTEMFHDHGDTIAVQYGGSNLVNTMDSYRRINQWSSHTRDILNSIKRIYSNSFIDVIRQEAINLFLGNYVYRLDKPKLWELQNDYYLHNQGFVEDFTNKNSYRRWFNSLAIDNHKAKHIERCNEDHRPHRFDPNELSDNWFNECYVPRKYQSFSSIFQFNMNSNARYFPSSTNEAKSFDYSPFGARKSRMVLKDKARNQSSNLASLSSQLRESSQYKARMIDNAINTVEQFSTEGPFQNFPGITCQPSDQRTFAQNIKYPQNLTSSLPEKTNDKPLVQKELLTIYHKFVHPPRFQSVQSSTSNLIKKEDSQEYRLYLELQPESRFLMANEQYI